MVVDIGRFIIFIDRIIDVFLVGTEILCERHAIRRLHRQVEQLVTIENVVPNERRPYGSGK